LCWFWERRKRLQVRLSNLRQLQQLLQDQAKDVSCLLQLLPDRVIVAAARLLLLLHHSLPDGEVREAPRLLL
jgi:hypothetical protein